MALSVFARTLNHFAPRDRIYDVSEPEDSRIRTLDTRDDANYFEPQPDALQLTATGARTGGAWMPHQDWHHVAGNVQADPLAYQWNTIATLITPFSVLIDLSSVDVNDHFVVRESILLDLSYPATRDNGVSYTDGIRRNWQQVAIHNLRVASSYLYIDDTRTDPTQIAVVQPMSGPWIAKIEIAQVLGISKTVRYLVF